MASSILNPNSMNKKVVPSSSLLLSGAGGVFDQTIKSSTNTTFVQADSSTFRSVVQSLTGNLPAAAKPNSGKMGPRRSVFKLHERRKMSKKLEINLNNRVGSGGYVSSREYGGEIMMVSPVSTLDLFARGSPKELEEDEERAIIADKGFYLHPSTPREGSEPELLPLFPLHSPNC